MARLLDILGSSAHPQHPPGEPERAIATRTRRIHRIVEWWVRVESDDPVRRALNQGFAVCIGILGLSTLCFLAVYLVAGGPIHEIGITAASIPILILGWWLNRHGTIYGAAFVTIYVIVGTTLAVRSIGLLGPGCPHTCCTSLA